MAKEIETYVKLQVPAGQASPSPPVGPALGQHGLPLMDFCNAFNARTKDIEPGLPCPVVITVYEEVLPFNILPAMLLRNVVLMDTEKIQDLGGLELDEEDLSLCSYVCPGKYDFGSLLRAGLTKIEVEG